MARDMSRRALLTGALPAALALSTVPALSAQTDPDAELIEAWSDLAKAHRAFDKAVEMMPGGGTDEDHEPYWHAIDACELRVESFQAVTVAGFAVQLRYLFAKRAESMDAFKWAYLGEPITEELAAMLDEDVRDKLLFNMAEAASRAGGLSVGSKPESQRQFPEGGA